MKLNLKHKTVNWEADLKDLDDFFDDGTLTGKLPSIGSLMLQPTTYPEIKHSYHEYINKYKIPHIENCQYLNSIKIVSLFKHDLNIFEKHKFNESISLSYFDDVKKVYIDDTNSYMILENIINDTENSENYINHYFRSIEAQIRASIYNICPVIYYILVHKTKTKIYYYRVQDYINIANNFFHIMCHLSSKKLSHHLTGIFNIIYTLSYYCGMGKLKLNEKSFIYYNNRLMLYTLDCETFNDNFIENFLYTINNYFKSVLCGDYMIVYNVLKKQSHEKIMTILFATLYEYIMIHNMHKWDLSYFSSLSSKTIWLDNVLLYLIEIINTNNLITKNDITETELLNISHDFIYNPNKFVDTLNNTLEYYNKLTIENKIINIVIPYFVNYIIEYCL